MISGYLSAFGKERIFKGKQAIDISVTVSRGYDNIRHKVIYDRFWVRVIGYSASVKLKDARKGDLIHVQGYLYTTKNLKTGIELVKIQAEWLEVTHGQWMNWNGIGKRMQEAELREKHRKLAEGDAELLGLRYDAEVPPDDTKFVYNDAEVLLADDGKYIRKNQRTLLVPRETINEDEDNERTNITAADEAEYLTKVIDELAGRAGCNEGGA